MDDNVEYIACIYDADYVTVDKKTSVRLWGVTDKGETITIVDRKFMPYFYAEVSSQWKSSQRTGDVMRMIRELNEISSGPIRKVETVNKRYLGEEREFIKITVYQPTDILWVWDIIQKWPSIKSEYEFGIPFRKRYIIDRDIPVIEWAKFTGRPVDKGKTKTDIMIDIQDVNRYEEKLEMPPMRTVAADITSVKDEIISIGISDGDKFRKVLTCGEAGNQGFTKADDNIEVMDTEKDLIERFISYIDEYDPHMIFTFAGDSRECMLLEKRAKDLDVLLTVGRDGEGLSFYKKGKNKAAIMCGRVHIDMKVFIDDVVSRRSSVEGGNLESAIESILGKDINLLKASDIENIKRRGDDLTEIADNSSKRAENIFLIAKRYIPFIFQLANICRQTVFDVSRMRHSQMIDWILVREAYRLNEIILNLPKAGEISKRYSIEPYEGGYLQEPVEGIHKDIAMIEFRDLYPSIVLKHNVSPEMIDTEEIYREVNSVPESVHFFGLKRRGFVPSVVLHSSEEIKRTKEIIDSGKYDEDSKVKYYLESRIEALQMLANSVYGYFAYPGSRWYSRICASSITAWGRRYMKNIAETAESGGTAVIYADTYSIFLAGMSEGKARKFIDDIRKMMPSGCRIAFEGSFKRGIFVKSSGGRAKYALTDRKKELTVKGFEMSRRDSPGIVKNVQKDVIKHILIDKSFKKAEECVQRAIEKINNGGADIDELIIRNQISRPVERYEQNWPFVSAAKKMIERGKKVPVGSVVEYIITKGEGSVSERAQSPEYSEDYDPHYYVNNQILSAVTKIMETAGMESPEPAENETESDGQDAGQRSINDFMKKGIKDKLKGRFGV